MKSIYLIYYYNSGQNSYQDYNRTADMMSHTSKQHWQYKKIIKDKNITQSNPSIIFPCTPLSTILFFIPSTFSFSSSSISSRFYFVN